MKWVGSWIPVREKHLLLFEIYSNNTVARNRYLNGTNNSVTRKIFAIYVTSQKKVSFDVKQKYESPADSKLTLLVTIVASYISFYLRLKLVMANPLAHSSYTLRHSQRVTWQFLYLRLFLRNC